MHSLKRAFLSIILILITIWACESESEPNEMDLIDSEPPSVTINGLDDAIETLTTLTIQIIDVSQSVNTSISINNNEILSSNEKQFSFQIDPFQLPVGQTSLRITSTDTDGNSSEINRVFELKKLLMKVSEDLPRFNVESQEVFYAANTMEGVLLDFVEVPTRQTTVKLYAPDDFVPQPIQITSYLLSSAVGPALTATTFSNIEPGTNFLPLQENVGILTENNSDEVISRHINDSFFTLSLIDIPFEPEPGQFFGFGSNYGLMDSNISGSIDNGFNFEIEFGYQDSKTKNIFLTNGNFGNLAELGELRYARLEEFMNKSISFAELNVPIEIENISIPLANERGSRLRLDGITFNNSSNFDDFNFLYSTNFVSIGIGNTVSNIEIPKPEGFDALRLTANLNLANVGGKELGSSTIGIQDIIVPSWEAAYDGTVVTTSGDFDLMSLEVASDFDNFILEKSFRWTYFSEKQDQIEVSFDEIEIPQIVLDNPKFPQLETSTFLPDGNLSILLESFSIEQVYEQRLFRNIFQRGKRGDELSLKIPLNY